MSSIYVFCLNGTAADNMISVINKMSVMVIFPVRLRYGCQAISGFEKWQKMGYSVVREQDDTPVEFWLLSSGGKIKIKTVKLWNIITT